MFRPVSADLDFVSLEESELARIATVRATLPEAAQKALDAVSDVDGKRAVLAALAAVQPADDAKKGAKVPPGGAPGAGPVDWATIARSNDTTAIREAKARDPDGWRALSGGGRTQRQPTFVERQQAAWAERNSAKAPRR